MKSDSDDARWMRRALDRAAAAAAAGEVPVGAVVVGGDGILGESGNATLAEGDPTAHAELVAIRAAARSAGNHRLSGATLYTTLEPCPMCAGAIIQARIERVVIAAADPKAGAAGSVVSVIPNSAFNHRPVVEFGLMAEESAELLRSFFRARRGPKHLEPCGAGRDAC